MTNETCKRAKFHKGEYLAGLCANCGEPIIERLSGVYVRSSKVRLQHTTREDSDWLRRMARKASR
jgi:hypothetical protein